MTITRLASHEFRALGGYTTHWQMTCRNLRLGVEVFVEYWDAVDVDIKVTVGY
jgi:hypothetical protein